MRRSRIVPPVRVILPLLSCPECTHPHRNAADDICRVQPTRGEVENSATYGLFITVGQNSLEFMIGTPDSAYLAASCIMSHWIENAGEMKRVDFKQYAGESFLDSNNIAGSPKPLLIDLLAYDRILTGRGCPVDERKELLLAKLRADMGVLTPQLGKYFYAKYSHMTMCETLGYTLYTLKVPLVDLEVDSLSTRETSREDIVKLEYPWIDNAVSLLVRDIEMMISKM